MQRLGQLFGSSSLATLTQLLQPVLLPLCAAVLHGAAQLRAKFTAKPGSALDPEALRADQAARGAAWAYLGAARLHLVLPPTGADPAAKHALKRAHVLRVLHEEVAPGLEVGAPLCCPSLCGLVQIDGMGICVLFASPAGMCCSL